MIGPHERRRALVSERFDDRARLHLLLMSVLGHDLRNPLRAVEASAMLLLDSDRLEGADRHAATVIASGASRMQRMIEQLLDVARSQTSATFPVVREVTDLDPIVRSVVSELATARPQRMFHVIGGGDTRGFWDPDRLAQVIDNVVGNADAHAPAGTPIRILLAGHSRENEVTLTVMNDGPSIPLDVQRTIFEPFHRGATPRTKGLGLGLFICKEIVEAHGGTLAVSSSDREGTAFAIRLPRDHGDYDFSERR